MGSSQKKSAWKLARRKSQAITESCGIAVADQAVAVVYLGEQGHSSILEAVVHPDLPTVVQQHIVGDVVSSGRENGKRSWKPRILESMTLNDGSCASITLLY